MFRVLVAMALEIEGQGVFEAAGVPVLYTGVGKINATYRLARALATRVASDAPCLVLNLGTAGSTKFAVGELVSCSELVQRDMDASPLGFAPGVTPFDDREPILRFRNRFPELPAGVCGSGDNFETGAKDVRCNVFDMEAYALAKVCALEGVEFACVKYITDGAGADAAISWQENLAHAAAHWLELHARAAVRMREESGEGMV